MEQQDPCPTLCLDILVAPRHCLPPLLHLRITEAQTARAPWDLGWSGPQASLHKPRVGGGLTACLPFPRSLSCQASFPGMPTLPDGIFLPHPPSLHADEQEEGRDLGERHLPSLKTREREEGSGGSVWWEEWAVCPRAMQAHPKPGRVGMWWLCEQAAAGGQDEGQGFGGGHRGLRGF